MKKTPGSPIHQPIGCLHHDKVCAACGQTSTPKGHDPCICDLPGVKYACCGHGIRDGYIYFDNGTIIRFIPLVVEQYNEEKPRGKPWFKQVFSWL